MNYSELTHLRWTIEKLTIDIEINDSILRTIDEIKDLWRSGVLTDREYVEISKRIGW